MEKKKKVRFRFLFRFRLFRIYKENVFSSSLLCMSFLIGRCNMSRSADWVFRFLASSILHRASPFSPNCWVYLSCTWNLYAYISMYVFTFSLVSYRRFLLFASFRFVSLSCSSFLLFFSIWFGVVYGLVWFGLVWFGLVWFGFFSFRSVSFQFVSFPFVSFSVQFSV